MSYIILELNTDSQIDSNTNFGVSSIHYRMHIETMIGILSKVQFLDIAQDDVPFDRDMLIATDLLNKNHRHGPETRLAKRFFPWSTGPPAVGLPFQINANLIPSLTFPFSC